MDCVVESQPIIGICDSASRPLSDSSDGEEINVIRRKSKPHKFQSDDEEQSEQDVSIQTPQIQRLQTKRSKLKEKFFKLASSRSKGDSNNEHPNSPEESEHDDVEESTKHTVDPSIYDRSQSSTDNSDQEDDTSVIKKKYGKAKKGKSTKLLDHVPESTKHTVDPSIYDRSPSSSENSDQEDDISQIKKKYHGKTKKEKSTKLLEHVPMSTKQAMENMQKIKSESNRMLREKEVSLPYHRPKALSLKDIMSRRKPAMSSDGKTLPLKMNDKQLKEYAQMLEQRQKEIIELCKSDSENEEEETEKIQSISEKTSDKGQPTSNEPETLSKGDIVSSETELAEVAKKNNQEILTTNNNTENPTNIDKNIEPLEESRKFNKVGVLTDQLADEIPSDMKNTECDIVSLEKELTEVAKVQGTLTTNTDTENPTKIDKNIEPLQESSFNKVNVLTDQIVDETLNDNKNTERDDSQLISLHYSEDTEKGTVVVDFDDKQDKVLNTGEHTDSDEDTSMDVDFPHHNFTSDEIEDIMAEAEAISSQLLNGRSLKPKLTGAPGMVIDLDDGGSQVPKKSGVELLKERFTYFAKLRTDEEKERENEKRIKPANHHQKLKQELEEKIAEQRSLEWAKRLEEEKLRQSEINEMHGDSSDVEDDLEKMEAKLKDIDDYDIKAAIENENGSVKDEDLVEDDVDMSDKKRNRNDLLEDEAEESEVEEGDGAEVGEDCEDGAEGEEEDDDDSSDDTSSESEEEVQLNKKKGRILKAFEDSDDEGEKVDNQITDTDEKNQIDESSPNVSQDEDLPPTQLHHSVSEDLFLTQKSNELSSESNDKEEIINDKSNIDSVLNRTAKTDTQTCEDASGKIKDIVDMCSGTFSRNLVENEPERTQAELSQASNSTPLGDNVLELCTGKFYENKFVESQEESKKTEELENGEIEEEKELPQKPDVEKENTLLRSILDELDDPDFDKPKQNKYFAADSEVESSGKKRFFIESDEDEAVEVNVEKRRKKLKKKRQKRTLNISDDEDDVEENNLDDDDENYDNMDEEMDSDINDCNGDEQDVEYDSEENEIQVKPTKLKKKTNEFFEQEAELTSEDEWVGSGDEDEVGLDRMEREEGDEDKFNQSHLLRELGQIHMREVLDQDKREVRMIQELLLEDGDLGDGHRQRKFKWKNIDGEEETSTVVDEFGETQVEEFESEEQWRRQRHERETFLKQQMKENEEAESPNVSINRTTIIKANLASKTMSNLLLELNTSKIEKTEVVLNVEKKQTSKDIPSPVKKPFTMLQQNFRGSLLSRGQGALARLAALAAPLAETNEQQTTSVAPVNRRNFVFAAISPQTEQKVVKRKADSNPGTPSLLKKLRTEERREPRRSLIDHMKL